GLASDRDILQQSYFEAKVVSTKQDESIVKLLSIFAQHLSMLSNQVGVQQENSDPPVIIRAKEYIHEHQTEELSLGQVAKAVNTSTFYFCKMFKKVTGINFTDYLSRIRIEKAKNLLLNPNLHQRNCLCRRLSIPHPFQSRLQEDSRPVPDRLSDAGERELIA